MIIIIIVVLQTPAYQDQDLVENTENTRPTCLAIKQQNNQPIKTLQLLNQRPII